MRVLYWTELFRPYIGGVEMMASRYLPAMQARGYELCVVTSHGSLELPDEAEYDRIAVHRFRFQTALEPGRGDELAAELQRVASLKRAFRPDLVHLNFSDPSVFFHLRTARAWAAPLLVALRVAPPSSASGSPDTLVGKMLRSASWVTANSEAILSDARRLVAEITPRSSVVYNGLPLPPLPPSPLPFDPPRLLCLGRLVADKGFDLAVSAFALLAARFPAARLVIAGDGPARAALARQAAELGVAARVDLPGWIAPDDVPALMNTATVVIMPSRWREAFGVVALQAAQMARPVVATRVGGLPEVVAHETTGMLVEKEDRVALANAIAYLLDHSHTAEQMGRAGRERAMSLFSFAQHVDAYDSLYRAMTKETAQC